EERIGRSRARGAARSPARRRALGIRVPGHPGRPRHRASARSRERRTAFVHSNEPSRTARNRPDAGRARAVDHGGPTSTRRVTPLPSRRAVLAGTVALSIGCEKREAPSTPAFAAPLPERTAVPSLASDGASGAAADETPFAEKEFSFDDTPVGQE